MSIEPRQLIETLEATGDYRVLRRVIPNEPTPLNGLSPIGMVLDIETTGLDPKLHEIVELAMVPFCYDRDDGRVLAVGTPLEFFNQPKEPIGPEMTAIHGITNEMVADHYLDPDIIGQLIAGVAPIIAHHASFDRPFCERAVPTFAEQPWVCSMEQIDWRAEGFSSRALDYLALASGFFYERHRATSDAWAVLELLRHPLPRSGTLALSQLLDTGRKPAWRVWAEDSPFPMKDTLKARGYFWDPSRKIWYIDCADDDAEIRWLAENVYRRPVTLPVTRINALNRFSDRIEITR